MLEQVVRISRLASDEILRIYNKNDYEVETKEAEKFPVTEADKAGSKIIVSELSKISEYPIISEEGEARESAKRFWLVDPLDGTKEFISRNGEFTVNIALIERNEPVLGVVLVPVTGVVYTGLRGDGSYKIDGDNKTKIEAVFEGEKPMVVASRSHKNEETQKFLDLMGEHDEMSMGSSLKMCLVAEGKAMLYPRYVPTYLWDTAAADAVVRAAGGEMCNLKGGSLVYDPRENMKNPFFVAATKNSIDWREIAKKV